MASTSEELSSQAEQLQAAIGFFKLGNSLGAKTPVRKSGGAAAKPAAKKAAASKSVLHLSHAKTAGVNLELQDSDELFEKF